MSKTVTIIEQFLDQGSLSVSFYEVYIRVFSFKGHFITGHQRTSLDLTKSNFSSEKVVICRKEDTDAVDLFYSFLVHHG